MLEVFDLGTLQWTLSGWTPFVWQQQHSIESGVSLNAEVPAIPARVPGSVQGALRAAGVLPDWNVALNARQYEFCENRHWLYTATIPDHVLVSGREVRLRALGLDYCGWILLNGVTVTEFVGSFTPHVVDLTPHLRERDNVIQLVFGTPPRWLGQIGYTSQMREWKPRFNYFWDWTSRLVQIGVWDSLLLESSDGAEIAQFGAVASAHAQTARGELMLRAETSGEPKRRIRFTLLAGQDVLRTEVVTDGTARGGVRWTGLDVALWSPNGYGAQALYELRCELLGTGETVQDSRSVRVGFRELHWETAPGAPPQADPWVCVVNGRPTFLQGVNWTPIRPNFADVSNDQYRDLIAGYRDMGVNLLRVWGGAFLEKEVFYDLCDEYGLLVWQEFPLSSSGLDNWPPEDADAVDELGRIARSYVERRRHHVSLAVWCGGNELQGSLDGQKVGVGKPVDITHPMIARLAEVVAAYDPGRRFLPTSSSGPRFDSDAAENGQGLHWDVHGPWHVRGGVDTDWREYWEADDALFRSEVGVAGASSVEIIREFKGELPELPGTHANPLWRRSSWWIDWPVFVQETGREPSDLEEFVAWSQQRQAAALAIAAAASRARFPECGGFLVWMGHDCFPCTANTSIIDFHGRHKPAAMALARVFRAGPNSTGPTPED